MSKNWFLYSSTAVNEISIRFKEAQIMTIKRYELYGFLDFISNCGGLMGLFMGISILSIIELLYYLVYFICTFFREIWHFGNRVQDVRQ
jgi:hypothetical protein